MRKCEVCGKKMFGGMTNECGDFHVCEDCFPDFMDKEFGKGKWMMLGNGEEDGMGGYYITTEDVVGGYQGTGIYYTEWEDEEEEEEEEAICIPLENLKMPIALEEYIREESANILTFITLARDEGYSATEARKLWFEWFEENGN